MDDREKTSLKLISAIRTVEGVEQEKTIQKLKGLYHKDIDERYSRALGQFRDVGIERVDDKVHDLLDMKFAEAARKYPQDAEITFSQHLKSILWSVYTKREIRRLLFKPKRLHKRTHIESIGEVEEPVVLMEWEPESLLLELAEAYDIADRDGLTTVLLEDIKTTCKEEAYCPTPLQRRRITRCLAYMDARPDYEKRDFSLNMSTIEKRSVWKEWELPYDC